VTTARERTHAIVETRRFLEALAYDDAFTDSCLNRQIAKSLLLYYPLNVDLEVSAAALPNVWACP